MVEEAPKRDGALLGRPGPVAWPKILGVKPDILAVSAGRDRGIEGFGEVPRDFFGVSSQAHPEIKYALTICSIRITSREGTIFSTLYLCMAYVRVHGICTLRPL